MSLFFSSLLQLLRDPNLVVSLLTQRQPQSLGNIISVTSLFQAFKLSTHYFYLSWSTLYSESLLFMFFLSLWLFFMASVTLPYLLETQHAVMRPFTQSQGQPPLVCFLIMMSEAQVPFLSLCMTTSSLILLPWVIWCCMFLYSWLYIPCFSSSALGALPYLFILVPSFVFWHLAHTWKKSIQIIWSSSCPPIWIDVSFWSFILSHLIFMSLLNSCFSLCPSQFNTLLF